MLKQKIFKRHVIHTFKFLCIGLLLMQMLCIGKIKISEEMHMRMNQLIKIDQTIETPKERRMAMKIKNYLIRILVNQALLDNEIIDRNIREDNAITISVSGGKAFLSGHISGIKYKEVFFLQLKLWIEKMQGIKDTSFLLTSDINCFKSTEKKRINLIEEAQNVKWTNDENKTIRFGCNLDSQDYTVKYRQSSQHIGNDLYMRSKKVYGKVIGTYGPYKIPQEGARFYFTGKRQGIVDKTNIYPVYFRVRVKYRSRTSSSERNVINLYSYSNKEPEELSKEVDLRGGREVIIELITDSALQGALWKKARLEAKGNGKIEIVKLSPMHQIDMVLDAHRASWKNDKGESIKFGEENKEKGTAKYEKNFILGNVTKKRVLITGQNKGSVTGTYGPYKIPPEGAKLMIAGNKIGNGSCSIGIREEGGPVTEYGLFSQVAPGEILYRTIDLSNKKDKWITIEINTRGAEKGVAWSNIWLVSCAPIQQKNVKPNETDLIAEAQNASWQNDKGEILSFGYDGGEKGAVFYDNVELENINLHYVLSTHPPHQKDGSIIGTYGPFKIPVEKAKFLASGGLSADAEGGKGVKFHLRIQMWGEKQSITGKPPYLGDEKYELFEVETPGHIKAKSINFNNLENKIIKLQLIVLGGNYHNNRHAFLSLAKFIVEEGEEVIKKSPQDYEINTINLTGMAEKARWNTTYKGNTTLRFGEDNSPNPEGAVYYCNTICENTEEITNTLGLRLPGDKARILGAFELTIPSYDASCLEEKPWFVSRVGFQQLAPHYDSVKFSVFFQDNHENSIWSQSVTAEYDGVLDILEADLSPIAGKSGTFFLAAGLEKNESKWCRVVWVNPRIYLTQTPHERKMKYPEDKNLNLVKDSEEYLNAVLNEQGDIELSWGNLPSSRMEISSKEEYQWKNLGCRGTGGWEVAKVLSDEEIKARKTTLKIKYQDTRRAQYLLTYYIGKNQTLERNISSNEVEVMPAQKEFLAFKQSKNPGIFWYIRKEEILYDLEERLKNPYVIGRYGQNLCGPAALEFLLCLRKPKRFVQAIQKLFETGKIKDGFCGSHIQTIWPPWHKVKENNTEYWEAIPSLDWMFQASLRNSENCCFDFDPGDAFEAMTFPGEMEDWFEYFLEIPEYQVTDVDTMAEAQRTICRGGVVAILVDTDLFKGEKTSWYNWKIPRHWIVFLGELEYPDAFNLKMSFKIQNKKSFLGRNYNGDVHHTFAKDVVASNLCNIIVGWW